MERGARIFGIFAVVSRVCACQTAGVAAAVGQEKAACIPKLSRKTGERFNPPAFRQLADDTFLLAHGFYRLSPY